MITTRACFPPQSLAKRRRIWGSCTLSMPPPIGMMKPRLTWVDPSRMVGRWRGASSTRFEGAAHLGDAVLHVPVPEAQNIGDAMVLVKHDEVRVGADRDAALARQAQYAGPIRGE